MSPFSSLTNKTALSGFFDGGKEREHAGGRNSYDFSARCLISPLAQWGVPDRQSESFYPYSPYSYCGGDPINYIDPAGRAWYCTTKIKFDSSAIEFELAEAILYTPYDRAEFDRVPPIFYDFY